MDYESMDYEELLDEVSDGNREALAEYERRGTECMERVSSKMMQAKERFIRQ